MVHFDFRKATVLILAAALVVPSATNALTLPQRLKGRIVLQTEKNGEAWYVRPDNQLRLYMGRPSDAFELMRSLGLGISNADLRKIPVGILAGELGGRDADDDGIFDGLEQVLRLDMLKADTDGDGYNDLDELQSGNDPLSANTKLPIDTKLTIKLHGKILLQAESKGEAWYVNPADSKRYYLGRPNDAFFIMRSLGLGITNIDLAKISEGRMPAVKIPQRPSSYELPSVGSKASKQKEVGVKTYVSKKLGISFDYLTKEGDPIIEEGDTVFVNGKEGQFVRKFSKSAQDSLKTAVRKHFLASASAECTVTDGQYFITTEYPNETAEIINSQKGGDWDPDSKCAGSYERANGISYFLMDKNHPSSFYFFSIGQYSISAGLGHDPIKWQHTFQVLK